VGEWASCAKTDEPIIMLFGGLNHIGTRKEPCVRRGTTSDESICMDKGWQVSDVACFATLLWMLVMAAKGKAIIFYRCNFFFFYFISKRLAMGSEPNLAHCSEVVSIYKCPQNFGALPPNLGRKNIKFLSLLWQLPNSTPHTFGMKRRIDKPKCCCQSAVCSLNVDLLSETFDPETAEICPVIATHSMKIQHFLLLPGFPHKGQPNFARC